MSTSLKGIESGDGVSKSETFVTVFCGHSDLLKTEPTRRCVQITVRSSDLSTSYSQLTDSGLRALIAQLQAVLDGDYQKFEE